MNKSVKKTLAALNLISYSSNLNLHIPETIRTILNVRTILLYIHVLTTSVHESNRGKFSSFLSLQYASKRIFNALLLILLTNLITNWNDWWCIHHFSLSLQGVIVSLHDTESCRYSIYNYFNMAYKPMISLKYGKSCHR